MESYAVPGRLSREDPDLSERQRELFLALVRLHEDSARPVGSESLAQAGIALSPASIRHALGELESFGLLERAHASAGRVPSARGYEFLVRALLMPRPLPAEVTDEIRRRLATSTHDVEHLLQEASRLLSTLTRQLGLAVAHSIDTDTLERIDLESLGERRVLMVLGLEGGAAQTLVLELDSPLERDELEEVASVLRERLVGHRIADVRERFAVDRELVRRSAVRLVVRAASQSWSMAVATPLISAGSAHIAGQPEFASSDQLSPILRAVETGTPLDRLMVSGIEGQAAVRVGFDESTGLSGCSLVSFPLPGNVRAAVGVLGPMRMNYARALAVVDTVGVRLLELFNA